MNRINVDISEMVEEYIYAELMFGMIVYLTICKCDCVETVQVVEIKVGVI